MLKELEILNDNFFRLYGAVYENTELLTKKQSDFMTDRLFEQYKNEYLKLALEKETSDKRDMFILRFRHGGYAPFKFLWWKNTAYKLLKTQLLKELDEYFDKKFSELSETSIGDKILNNEGNNNDVQ